MIAQTTERYRRVRGYAVVLFRLASHEGQRKVVTTAYSSATQSLNITAEENTKLFL